MTSNELEIFKQSILDEVRVMMQTTGQVTQYIGARYVPLFAEPLDWSADNEYEPLTVVLHKGNSFTSRQFVPKGIEITNEQFWANTGNYNAQIEQYKTEVEKLAKTVENNSSDILILKKLIKNASEFGFLPTASGIDNVNALNSALEYSKETGAIIYIPKGEYTLNSFIRVPWGVHIEGESIYNTILNFPNNQGFTNDVDINGFETTVGSTIKNLTIKGGYNFKSVPSQNDIYTYYEYGGIYGTFYNCCIERLNIQNFPVGISTKQNPTSIAQYNQLYNQIYGDNRTIEHINISYCYIGAFLNQWDCYYNDFRINNVFYVGNMLGYMNMLHAWNFSNALYCRSLIATNVEFDYQFNNPDIPSSVFNSALVCFGNKETSNQCTFSNLKFYNLVASSENQFFPVSSPQPIIRCVGYSELSVDNLYIGATNEGNHGWNSLDNETLPREIISVQANSHAKISGQILPRYTKMNEQSSSYQNIKADITTNITGYTLGNRPTSGKVTYESVG